MKKRNNHETLKKLAWSLTMLSVLVLSVSVLFEIEEGFGAFLASIPIMLIGLFIVHIWMSPWDEGKKKHDPANDDEFPR